MFEVVTMFTSKNHLFPIVTHIHLPNLLLPYNTTQIPHRLPTTTAFATKFCWDQIGLAEPH